MVWRFQAHTLRHLVSSSAQSAGLPRGNSRRPLAVAIVAVKGWIKERRHFLPSLIAGGSQWKGRTPRVRLDGIR
jgi:hypothetical protein